MPIPTTQRWKVLRVVTATPAQVLGAPGRIRAWQLVNAGFVDSTLVIQNGLTATGDNLIQDAVPAEGQGVLQDTGHLGPVQFSVGAFATLTGVGAVAYIWYE
jgi:hypothetical protein